MILRSLRRTPLRRHSLIWAIASPRTKLPNSGIKRPLRRMTRVQKRFLTVPIFFHRSRRAIFERRYAGSAEGFRRKEPDGAFATLASYEYALALYVVKERLLFRPVNVPKTEIIFVNQHLSAPSVRRTCWQSTRLVCDRRHTIAIILSIATIKAQPDIGSSTQSMFTICRREPSRRDRRSRHRPGAPGWPSASSNQPQQ